MLDLGGDFINALLKQVFSPKLVFLVLSGSQVRMRFSCCNILLEPLRSLISTPEALRPGASQYGSGTTSENLRIANEHSTSRPRCKTRFHVHVHVKEVYYIFAMLHSLIPNVKFRNSLEIRKSKVAGLIGSTSPPPLLCAWHCFS